MSAIHADRIEKLRAVMEKNGIDAYMIPTADYHNSEYAADYFHTREYFSGFTGSAGTLVVRREEACLWTDGRYFIQAAGELEGSGITLMKMGEPGVPSLEEYLDQKMEEGSVLGFDGRCVPYLDGKELDKMMRRRKGSLSTALDLADGIWAQRPSLPCHPVMILEDDYTGEDIESKLTRLREVMREEGDETYIDSKLDNIMWLLNIRGEDVTCNPVALTHVLVDHRNVYLFIQDGEVTGELRSYAALHRISILPYEDFEDFLAVYDHKGDMLCDQNCISYRVYLAAAEGLGKKSARYELIRKKSPVGHFKSVKNDVEIANIRGCYKRDSAVMCRFIKWLTERVADQGKEPLKESEAAARLDHMRSEISDFMDLSFSTISAYGPNAAMMHYEAVPGVSDAELKPEGMYLVDSGGQYLTGTTDVTRTVALGPVTDEMKKHYTLTAVSNLQLMGAVFMDGCTGINLDILAREPMWREGLDYKCGTGHGIGYYLGVHESPPSIRWKVFPGRLDEPFEPGMIVSDEPGVYLEGKYGIRIETILEVVKHAENENGRFFSFEPLTLVPFDRDLIDPDYLTPYTRKLLNDYHERVCTEIMPFLSAEEQMWLISRTEPI
jgi:Xaa-Pro aminopeptidase